mmetsp:Transcript_38911/g.34584  ORF Transcript_38911/g.34584 Transcript_38911/m.34584 type:complete len:206 (+) Transcript_38911:789-1406(+)
MKCIASIMKQILKALAFLHARGVAHRDVKLENIVLDKADPMAIAKLIDFGIALEAKDYNEKSFEEHSGTVFYMAPEIFGGKHDFKCDIWSLGIVLYVFLMGEIPFKGKTYDEVKRKICSKNIEFEGPKWNINPMVINFLKKLLEKDPSKRYSATQALQDPFIKKYCPEENITVSIIEQCLALKPKSSVEALFSGVEQYQLRYNSV